MTFSETKEHFRRIILTLIKYQFPKKKPYGTKNALKYFIGYNDNDVIRPLYLRLPQMTGYVGYD